MENDEEKILSIKVKYEDAINGIVKYRDGITEMIKKQKELKEELNDGVISQQEYSKEMEASRSIIKDYKDNIRVLEKEIQNNLRTEKEEEGSMKSLRAELSNLTKEYDELSKSERMGAQGQELKAHINQVTDEIRLAEEETQRYYRNVGNYENAIKGALGAESKWYSDLKNVSSMLGSGLKSGLETAKNAVASFGKQLLALLANPIVATIAAIVVAVKLLTDMFKKGVDSSASNSARLKEALAPLKVIIDELTKVCIAFVAQILSIVEAGGKLLGWVMSIAEKLPLVGDAFKSINEDMKEHIELEKEQIEYAKMSRDEIVKSAERENQIAKLRDKVAQKGKYNIKERRGFLQQAMALERQQANEKEVLAKKNLKILQDDYNQGKQNAEMLTKLAEARAAVTRADTEYYQTTRRMQTELGNFDTSEANDAQQKEKEKQQKAKEAAQKAKEAAKKRLENLREAKKNELSATREAEDKLLELMGDSDKAKRLKIQLSYQRELEDLQYKLTFEKNLTKKAKNEMTQEMQALQLLENKKLAELKDTELTERYEKEKKSIELLISSVKKGSDEEYELKLQLIEKQKQADLHAVDISKQTEEEKYNAKWAIRNKYNLMFDQLDDERNAELLKRSETAIKERFTNEILESGNDEDQRALLELQQKMELKKNELDSLQQLEGESIDEFNLRKLQKQQEYMDAKKALNDKEVDIEKAKVEAVSNVMGSLSNVFDALGEHNKAFAKLSKVLVLAQIAINTGEAIAMGVKQAQSVPYPANLVAIATTVATVLGNIATAIKTVNSAKFASGGAVSGSGTSTSDSVPARLSDGESVMTAAATSLFAPALSAFNQMGGGIPIVVSNSSQVMGEEFLANAVAKGMMKAPAPVVSIEEFTRVSNRVKYIESLGKV